MNRGRKRVSRALSSFVVRAIERCRADRLPVLDLRRMDLTEVPLQILGLKHIDTIDLSENQLTSIPAQLWTLPRLRWVSVVGNPIQHLPDHPGVTIDAPTFMRCRHQLRPNNIHLIVGSGTPSGILLALCADIRILTGIRRVTIGQWAISIGDTTHPKPSPEIQRLLDLIGELDSLTELSVRGLALRGVPSSLKYLTRLRFLDLSAVGLHELPPWLGLPTLEEFSCVDNSLFLLPESFAGCRSRKRLDLSFNKFRSIPSCLFELKSLESLAMRACPIREIPEEILSLEALTDLEAASESLESPPLEVARKGLDAIRDYWRQRSDTGVDYLCEAKLIILGEPGAGKTSLARKIQDPRYRLKQDEKSTEGIDVINYRFETAVRARNDRGEKLIQRTFQANIWDFGGQEIYHATHQFFLTRRSVYVLVCDDRREDTDFYYWLQVVEMLSDASPVLIVRNEKQNRARDINIGELRSRFANLREIVATNLEDNRGLSHVVESARRELEGLSHVGIGLPSTWKRVREALEADSRDVVSLSDYLAICERHGFDRLDDKLMLSGYLHDLGICLHFQDDPLLKNTVVLNPSWGTDAVYRVLDDREVLGAHGRFSRLQLRRIWSDTKYDGMQDELLGLMMKFQLCYALGGGDTFIAPQLLSSAQPSYEWDPTDSVVVRYEYEFMPKGMMTRFIVGMHHLIAGEAMVWKTGVMLQREGTRAEVTEEYAKRRIRVRLAGDNRWGLLAIIDDQLERLHASFPRLQCQRYLPCPCDECGGSSEPYGFALDKLDKMARKGQAIQCHVSGEMVDAGRLVRDVLPAAWMREEYRIEIPLRAGATEATRADDRHEAFVSYAWTEESATFVDDLQQALERQGIRVRRDRDEVRYKDSIREFMHRLGSGKAVVVVLSEKYLKSENCMFELLEIVKMSQAKDRIFPIVLNDADLSRAAGRVRYVRHWEDELRELDDALKTVRADNLTALQGDLNLYAEIRRVFDGIADMLRDMNALSPEAHRQSDFAEVVKRIRT